MTQKKTAFMPVKTFLQISSDFNFKKIMQIRKRGSSRNFLAMPFIVAGNVQTNKYWFQDTTFTHLYLPTLFTLLVLILVFVRMQRSELIREKNHLLEQNNKLKSLNDKKDKMISIISHDVNTSLATFYDLIEMIDPEDNSIDKIERKKLHQCLQLISKDTYLLFSNLITWSEIQLSEIDIKKEYFNLKDAVKFVFDIFRYKVKKKNITFRFTNRNDLDPIVYGDKLAVELILLNLLSNAIKNTFPGKTITVFLKNIPDFWEIEVLNFGMHIPEELIPELFDYRKTRLSYGVHNDNGIKLGLYIVKELAEGFGGRVSVRSNAGSSTGNYFTFSIPKPTE